MFGTKGLIGGNTWLLSWIWLPPPILHESNLLQINFVVLLSHSLLILAFTFALCLRAIASNPLSSDLLPLLVEAIFDSGWLSTVGSVEGRFESEARLAFGRG